MIGIFIKHWKLVLDLLIVIVAITLFFLWNPFNLFGDKLRLEDTANVISDVREIGQLITAEYYGEVVGTLDDSKLNILGEDTLLERGEFLYINLKKEIFVSYESYVLNKLDESDRDSKRNRVKKEGRKNVVSDVLNEYEKLKVYNATQLNIFLNDTFDIVLYFAIEKELGIPVIVNEKKFNNRQENTRKQLRNNSVENLYDYIAMKHANLSPEEFNVFLSSGFENSNAFTGFYYTTLGKESKKKDKLSMIGRGSVKAGYDFGTINEQNFKYDERDNVLHLFGLEPKILNYDINPWFIPQRAVPGFDIIQAGNNADFKDAVKVKALCREKLKAAALKAGILEEAEKYGAEVLKAFFSLILNKEIKGVYFHARMDNPYYTEIAKDSLISVSELAVIDTVEIFFQNKIKTSEGDFLKNIYDRQLKKFINDLHGLELMHSDSSKSPFNYFTRLLPAMMADSIITVAKHKAFVDVYRWKIDDSLFVSGAFKDHSHWFTDSTLTVDPYLFPEYFNTMVSEKHSLKILSDTVINKDSILYNFRVSHALVDSVSKLNSLQLEEMFGSSALWSTHRSQMQRDDIENYKRFLRLKNREYHKKSWILKWREEIQISEPLKDWSNNVRGSINKLVEN